MVQILINDHVVQSLLIWYSHFFWISQSHFRDVDCTTDNTRILHSSWIVRGRRIKERTIGKIDEELKIEICVRQNLVIQQVCCSRNFTKTWALNEMKSYKDSKTIGRWNFWLDLKFISLIQGSCSPNTKTPN